MTKRLGIEKIASFIAPQRVDFSCRMDEWALTESFLRDKIGVLRVARKQPGEKASDLAMAAFKAFSPAIDLREIQMTITVTQNPDRPIPHISAVLQHKLGVPAACLALDLSHGCSGYIYGLSVAQALMRDQGITKALLFTADPYSDIVDPNDRNTALLFGDAATVTLLSDNPVWECGKYSFYTDGAGADSLCVEDGILRMDGGAVFNFAARQVPKEIANVLAKNELRLDDISIFLLHSGSRYIVDTIAQRAGLPAEKVPFGIEEFGNTVSSSLPILLEKAFGHGGKRILLCGFGAGLSSAAVVLNRVNG